MQSGVTGPVVGLHRHAGDVYLRVHRFVLLEAHCVTERLAADVTGVRPRPAVRPADVDLQAMRG